MHLQSCIDVTMVRNMTNVTNWRVETEFNGSDNYTIHFDMNIEQGEVREYRPWDKANWEKFTEAMANKPLNFPETVTCKKLDNFLGKFYDTIETALDIACPKKTYKPPRLQHAWYSEDLALLHKEVQQAYELMKKKPSNKNRDTHKNLAYKYKRLCRTARKDSWRYFKQTQDTIKDMTTASCHNVKTPVHTITEVKQS